MTIYKMMAQAMATLAQLFSSSLQPTGGRRILVLEGIKATAEDGGHGHPPSSF